jgi:hypothetical protein
MGMDCRQGKDFDMEETLGLGINAEAQCLLLLVSSLWKTSKPKKGNSCIIRSPRTPNTLLIQAVFLRMRQNLTESESSILYLYLLAPLLTTNQELGLFERIREIRGTKFIRNLLRIFFKIWKRKLADDTRLNRLI